MEPYVFMMQLSYVIYGCSIDCKQNERPEVLLCLG